MYAPYFSNGTCLDVDTPPRSVLVLSRLSKFAIHSCHEFEVKKVKEKERARRKEVRIQPLPGFVMSQSCS